MSETTSLEVIPWTTVYGAAIGSVSWSSRVESQAAMGAAQDALSADPGFQERVAAQSHLFVGLAEDAIGEFVGFSGDRRHGSSVRLDRHRAVRRRQGRRRDGVGRRHDAVRRAS